MSVDKVRIQLEPSGVTIEVPSGTSLASVLSQHGVDFSCGGTSLCGSCRIRVLDGSLPVTQEDTAVFSAAELVGGWRLACQARARMPLVLQCGQWQMDILTDNSGLSGIGKKGLGIAIDLGTTTIAAQTIDITTGGVLGVQTELNPQMRFGSDVMSRVQAALSGADLTAVVRHTLRQMIVKLADGREQDIIEVVLVGNTVMHHLFAGLDVEPLSHFPFHSQNLN